MENPQDFHIRSFFSLHNRAKRYTRHLSQGLTCLLAGLVV